jgi:ElaB/YqjD/DUF883 family membrane-anchored ribosome-binding protein
MARLASKTRRKVNDGYFSRRAADYLHQGVDRVADTGETVERRLQNGYQLLDTQAQRLNSNVRGMVEHYPWAAIGGSVAIGFLVGMLSGRRF